MSNESNNENDWIDQAALKAAQRQTAGASSEIKHEREEAAIEEMQDVYNTDVPLQEFIESTQTSLRPYTDPVVCQNLDLDLK